MKKTAFLFPGQGSQFVGMGLDLYQEYDVVRELFDMVEEISKINISRLCFKGPLESLTETINLQPAITVVNLSCLAAIQKENISPDFSAGHSLGEYSALCSAGMVSREDTFRLVFKRGELMHRDATLHKGAMDAIIGLPIDVVSGLVSDHQNEGIVAVANHNAEHQIVITGEPDAVKKVSSAAVAMGAKSVSLKVSGAWHSELIKNAQEEFEQFINEISFCEPKSPMVFNVTGDIVEEIDEIKTMMAQQLCSPVKWYDTMRRLMEENVENFIEVGPGMVLSGLLKKTLPKDYPCKIYRVNNMKSLEQFFKEAT